jgi:pilus assembly protein CpaE
MAQHTPDGAGQAIRILIIDDLIETAQAVRRWLSTVPDLRVVGIATDAREGIALARRHQPDIILMDIYMPGMDGLAAAHILSMEVPAQIILMSVEDSKDLMQQAMDVGARGFLVKPLRSDDVLRAIRRVVQLPGPRPDPVSLGVPPSSRGQHLVAVCGAKGGVGCSILATNLAVALRACAEEVLLVDGNLTAGDDHVLLNLDHIHHSLDMLREPEELDYETLQSVAAQHESGIRFLRSPDDPELAREFRRETMRGILVEVREHCDVTVVDTDTAFTDANEAIIESADRFVIVTTPEITAVNRVKSLLESLRRRGIASDRCWLVGNRMDGGYQITPKRVEQSLGRRFAAQFPDDVRTVIGAVNRGIPFVTYARRAPITRIMHDLARRLYQDLQTTKKPRA